MPNTWTGDAYESADAAVQVISSLMKEDLWPGLLDAMVVRSPFRNRIDQVANQKDFTGKYGKGLLQTVFNRNTGPRKELQDFVFPLSDDFTDIQVPVFQTQSTIGWTMEEMRRVKPGDGSAIDLIGLKTKNMPIDIKRVQDFYDAGDGTGRMARVSAYNASTRVVTIDNTGGDFGWHLGQWIYDGALIDIHTVADITGAAAWTTKAIRVRVDQKTQAPGATACTFRITEVDGDANSEIKASPADSDYVFIYNAVTLTSANKFSAWNVPMGILGIADDGSSTGYEFTETAGCNGCWSGKTIWNKDRTLYNQLKCAMWRAGDWKTGGTDGTAEIASIDDIQEIIDETNENGPSGKVINALYMNSRTRNWFARKGAAQGVQIVNSTSGKITPGIFTKSMVTGNGLELDILPMPLPDGQMLGVCEDELTRFNALKMGWVIQNGSRVFVPGRNGTYESWMNGEDNLFGLSWTMVNIQDVNITA